MVFLPGGQSYYIWKKRLDRQQYLVVKVILHVSLHEAGITRISAMRHTSEDAICGVFVSLPITAASITSEEKPRD
jgi:hypothetical protein